MSQAEDLLNSLSAGGVLDVLTESHIVVDNDRHVIVPEQLKDIAVQFDHNIETVTFDCPRYFDGHDFTTMHVYINYMCPDKSKGQFLCENVTIDETDENIIHFDWTIQRSITQAIGKISFLICIKKIDDKGKLLYRWSSRLNQEMFVLEGLECSIGELTQENPDVIEQILLKLDTISEYGGFSKSYKFAEKVMLYYGYPNAINGSWDVNNSANIYKDYDVCIFGNKYCLPTHEAYAETVQIFNILKQISPDTKIVGYVPIGVQNVGGDSNLSMSELKSRVNAWVEIGVDGIFLDEFGYDYGVTRARQNEIVSYCHKLGLFVFANSWSTDYCFSDEDVIMDWMDNFRPNPNKLRAVLNENDYYVYEHLFYNSYTDDDGVLHIECAEPYRIDDILSYFNTPKIDGKSYRDVFGTKVFSLDSIPTAAPIAQKNEMMSLSIIGAAILNIDAIAFGDEFWGSASNYHQWDFPQLELKTKGINSISRDSRFYTAEDGKVYDFTYKWTSSINGNIYSIVFNVDTPSDVTYVAGKRYAECNDVKIDNVWLTIYDFQTFIADTTKKCEETDTLVNNIKKSVDEAMPTVVEAENKVNTFMVENQTKIEQLETRVNNAIGDIKVLTSGFNYLETEW